MSGLVAGAVMVTGVTALTVALRPHLPPVYLLSLYLLVALPLAVLRGTAMAVVISIVGMAAFEYYNTRPMHSFALHDPRIIVSFAAFLVTAIVVGELSARPRRAAQASARLSEEQSALRRVAILVAQSAAPSEVFDAVTREVGLLCGADLARMERYESGNAVTGVASWSRVTAHLGVGQRFELDGLSVAREVHRTGAPVRIDTFGDATGAIALEARALGVRSSVGCPIVATGRLWGVIAASTTREEAFPRDTEVQIGRFTELVATAVENAEAREELTRSRARIVAAADQARRQIERDLHDGAQQRLVSLALQLRATQAAIPADLDDLAAELDSAGAALTEAVDDLREMARGIHPAIIAEGGLAAALRVLARRSAVPVDLAVLPERDLPDRIEISTYYIVSEALTNAAKYADASTVTVSVHDDGDVLHIVVRDDGVGGADCARGSGLTGLKDRAQALGGRITLHSPPGMGTVVSADLPIAAAKQPSW